LTGQHVGATLSGMLPKRPVAQTLDEANAPPRALEDDAVSCELVPLPRWVDSIVSRIHSAARP